MNLRMIEADYNVPTEYMRQMSSLEIEIEILKRSIALLDDAGSDGITIEDTQTIIDLFQTDEGRAKLNSFFKSNDIIFYASHIKSTRSTVFRMHRKNSNVDERISGTTKVFPLKNILQEFGLGDLQTMFDLTIN